MHEDIVFWKWVSSSILGLVTESAVYHWDLLPDSVPLKLFDRNPNMAGTQIINYKVNDESKWCLLIGISAQQGRVVGSMQLFSKDRNVSQPLEGHAAAFATIKLDGSQSLTNLFTFSVRTAVGAKLHIVYLLLYRLKSITRMEIPNSARKTSMSSFLQKP